MGIKKTPQKRNLTIQTATHNYRNFVHASPRLGKYGQNLVRVTQIGNTGQREDEILIRPHTSSTASGRSIIWALTVKQVMFSGRKTASRCNMDTNRMTKPALSTLHRYTVRSRMSSLKHGDLLLGCEQVHFPWQSIDESFDFRHFRPFADWFQAISNK